MLAFLWLVGAVVIFGTSHWAVALCGLSVLAFIAAVRRFSARGRRVEEMRAAYQLEYGRTPTEDLVEGGRMAGGGGLSGVAGATIGALINVYQDRNLTVAERQAAGEIRVVERQWTLTWFVVVQLGWAVCAMIAGR